MCFFLWASFGFLSRANSHLSSELHIPKQYNCPITLKVDMSVQESWITEQLLNRLSIVTSSSHFESNWKRVTQLFEGVFTFLNPSAWGNAFILAPQFWQMFCCVAAARDFFVEAASKSSLSNLLFLQPKFFMKLPMTSCWIHAQWMCTEVWFELLYVSLSSGNSSHIIRKWLISVLKILTYTMYLYYTYILYNGTVLWQFSIHHGLIIKSIFICFFMCTIRSN